MPNNSIMSSPCSSSRWWPGDQDISMTETYSPRASSVGGYSAATDDTNSVITLPVLQSPATTMPARLLAGRSTPEVMRKIESASPETARHVAMRMYESLKRHGLRDEAGRAFRRESDDGEIELEEVKEGGEVRKKSEDLLGMEYLLKDGFVSYLRDVAKITPPIPQQVVRFSGIKCSRKFDIPRDEYETFGNKVLGCFVGPFKTLLQKKNSTWLHILKGVDVVGYHPCEGKFCQPTCQLTKGSHEAM